MFIIFYKNIIQLKKLVMTWIITLSTYSWVNQQIDYNMGWGTKTQKNITNGPKSGFLK
jgi:hypothetical protein